MVQKIIKTGNSAAVTVPAEFMEALGLRVGDLAETEMDYRRGTIVFKFPNGRQLPLDKTVLKDRRRKNQAEK